VYVCVRVRACVGERREGLCIKCRLYRIYVLNVNHLVTKLIPSCNTPPPHLSYKSKYWIHKPFLLANAAASFFGGWGGTRKRNYKIKKKTYTFIEFSFASIFRHLLRAENHVFVIKNVLLPLGLCIARPPAP
jgi:hypothetical protein